MNYDIAIFAKSPIPGHVKTRLTSTLSAESAARLYEAFLCDTVRKALLLIEYTSSLGNGSATDGSLVIYHDGPADGLRDTLSQHMGDVPVSRWVPQASGDLGDRLSQVDTPCFITPSDSPTVPMNFLYQAADQFGRYDVIIGPAIDGGYYLLGLRKPNKELFERIPWGTRDVLSSTRDRAASLGLQTRLLPAWYPVVTSDDLRRLRIEMETLPENTPDDAPYTRAALRDLL